MDIRWGYNNIRIKEGDEWKATFTTPFGLYEPLVMFFGQCNSPPTFQVFMDSTFGDMITKGWLIIYMDDVLVFVESLEECQTRTKQVLERMKEEDLHLKLAKCAFCCTCSTRHGIHFPFLFHATLCHFPPNHLCHTVQARLCCKCCRHIIGLGPYCLSMTSYPLP